MTDQHKTETVLRLLGEIEQSLNASELPEQLLERLRVALDDVFDPVGAPPEQDQTRRVLNALNTYKRRIFEEATDILLRNKKPPSDGAPMCLSGILYMLGDYLPDEAEKLRKLSLDLMTYSVEH